MRIHRSHKVDKFIKLVDKTLLKAYFAKKGLQFGKSDELTPDKAHEIIDAIKDENARLDVEEELFRMDDITDRDVAGLNETIIAYGINAGQDDSPQTLAMKLFLHDNPEAFNTLYDSYLCKAYSDKLLLFPLSSEQVDDGEKALAAMEKELEEHFKCKRQTDECVIRTKEYQGMKYVLVTRADHLRSIMTMKSKRMWPQVIRPAKEDVICYDPNRNVIGVSSGFRSNATKHFCVSTFSKHVLHKETVDDNTFAKDNGLIKLAPVLQDDFYEPTEKIQVKMTAAYFHYNGELEATANLESDDVRATIKEIGFPVNSCVLLAATLAFEIKDKKRPVSVAISKKGLTAIKHREDKAVIEEFLRDRKVICF